LLHCHNICITALALTTQAKFVRLPRWMKLQF
jgi:hypothetical protein